MLTPPTKLCLYLLMMFSTISCGKPKAKEDLDSGFLKLKDEKVVLYTNEKKVLKFTEKPGDIAPNEFIWNSSNEEVAFVTERGEINAIQPGTTKIEVRYKSFSASCEVTISKLDEQHPLELTVFNQPFSPSLVYSFNVPLIAPYRVMQSFDFDQTGNIYYSQIGVAGGFEQGKTKAHELYIVRSTPNTAGTEYMTLKYFGHGANIAIDEVEGETYVWVGSNGSKATSGEYWDEMSVSKISYHPDKEYIGHGGESYFLNNGLMRVNAAVNRANDLLCINATQNGVRHFFTYKLSEAEALSATTFDISVKVGGEEEGEKEKIVQRSVQGKDLSLLEPLGNFQIEKGHNTAIDINSLAFQGYDIDGSRHIYFFEGEWAGTSGEVGLAQAYVTVFDLDGSIVKKRSKISAISQIDELEKARIVNSSGYMEAEGIKIKGNQIYLGFASYKEVENYRRANILTYKSERN